MARNIKNPKICNHSTIYTKYTKIFILCFQLFMVARVTRPASRRWSAPSTNWTRHLCRMRMNNAQTHRNEYKFMGVTRFSLCASPLPPQESSRPTFRLAGFSLCIQQARKRPRLMAARSRRGGPVPALVVFALQRLRGRGGLPPCIAPCFCQDTAKGVTRPARPGAGPGPSGRPRR